MVVIDVAPERGHRSEIIHSRDRIEFVVVAVRAIDRQPHEPLERRPDHVVHVVVSIRWIVLLAEPDPRTDSIEGGCSQAVISRLIELIAGELLDDELVIWLVLIESL